MAIKLGNPFSPLYVLIVLVATFIAPPSLSAAEAVLRAHGIAGESLVPGEATDTAHPAAFIRARKELIESLAKTVAAQRQQPQTRELEATIADHANVRLLRSLIQEDERQLHLVVELEGTLDPGAMAPHSDNASLYHQSYEDFQRVRNEILDLRRQWMETAGTTDTSDILLRLERLGLETARLACFSSYALAGAGYCADYRRTSEESYDLAFTILRCGGESAWRAFSPFHRVVAHLNQQILSWQEGKLGPEQVLREHLRHKQVVRDHYPYLQGSKERSLFEPVQWKGPDGSFRSIPLEEWNPEMVMAVLQREIGVWNGMALGWHVMTSAISGHACPHLPEPAPLPSLAREHTTHH